MLVIPSLYIIHVFYCLDFSFLWLVVHFMLLRGPKIGLNKSCILYTLFSWIWVRGDNLLRGDNALIRPLIPPSPLMISRDSFSPWTWACLLPDGRSIVYSGRCLYIFLIYYIYHLRCLCNDLTELGLFRITTGFMEHLQRERHASREILPLRTPGSVPFWTCWGHFIPNLPWFSRVFHFEYPSVLSRFCLKLYCGVKKHMSCMIYRIWGLKQQAIQVNGHAWLNFHSYVELWRTWSKRKIENTCLRRE